MIQTIVMSLWY